MGARPAPNSARLLAPIALAVFAVVFFAVILSSGSGEQKRGGATAGAGKRASRPVRRSRPSTRAGSTYTVKVGDTLPGIAEKTGVSVQKLQELNPALDPYGLQSGQKVKLRE